MAVRKIRILAIRHIRAIIGETIRELAIERIETSGKLAFQRFRSEDPKKVLAQILLLFLRVLSLFRFVLPFSSFLRNYTTCRTSRHSHLLSLTLIPSFSFPNADATVAAAPAATIAAPSTALLPCSLLSQT